MNSPTDATKTPNPNHNLREQLERIGIPAVAAQLNDLLANATKQRWSPRQLLDQLAQVEVAERTHRSLERRLRTSEIRKFKPMVDFEWSWPTRIERDVIERALTLDFLPEARNLVLVGANGLGKTMIAQNICHAAVLAGHSVLFRTASAMLSNCIDHPGRTPAQAARLCQRLVTVHRRSRVSVLRRQVRRPALRGHQPALRAEIPNPDNQ